MGFNDLLYFNDDEYKIKITSYSDQDLHDDILKKRRQTSASGASIGVGIAFAHITGGISLASSAYSVRTVDIAYQKLAILEVEWEARGYERVHENVWRDKVLPIAVTGTTGAAVMGIEMGVSAAGAHAVTQASVNGVGQDAGHGYAVNAMAPHSAYVAQPVPCTYAGAEPLPAQSLAAYPPIPNAEHTLGKKVVEAGMHYGVNKAATGGQEYVAKKWK